MISFSQITVWFNLLLIFILICCRVFEASHVASNEDGNKYDKVINQPYRTAFHFQPKKNWMNDPNGPMMYKGMYHLFYQYNPKGAVWGNIIWAHSISTDLINWKSLPHALIPTHNYDINGVWSGSATILPDGRPAILYTGIDHKLNQVLNLALPNDLTDPLLKKWDKVPQNPLIIPNSKNKINGSSFRDPTTAWIGHDGEWRIIIGSKIEQRGLAILFKSKDFLKWTMIDHPLHYKDGNAMWECPDFYPVVADDDDRREGVDTSLPDLESENLKYVLKVSVDDTRKDYYTVGTYDKVKDVYVPDIDSIEDDSGLRYDYGKFYGSKTFYDSVKKRRVLWSWINESSPWEYDVKKGWHGLMNVPRSIWLDKDGEQLVQWPVEEINRLRKNQVGFSDKFLKKGSLVNIAGITGSQADVEVTFQIQTKALQNVEIIKSGQRAEHLCSTKRAIVSGTFGPFGMKVLATKDGDEYTAVFFRIFKTDTDYYKVLMCSDQSRSSLDEKHDKTNYGAFVDLDPRTEKFNLRILIDHSVVESFGGEGKSVITARVYPTKAIDNRAQLYAFNNGDESVTISKLSAWSMKQAKIN